MPCHVCNASEAEPHFGGITCRACAAFFRRYFHSKKPVIPCTCKTRMYNSHPCRECRIQKCIAAGMVPEKVQEKREKHPPKKSKSISPAETSSPSTSQESSPPALPLQIIGRNSSTISMTAFNWQKVQNKRNPLFDKTLDQTTYYDLSCLMRDDCRMVWDIIEDLMPQITWNLRLLDKEALIRNFLPKWSVLTAAIDMEKNVERYKKFNSLEDFKRMIVDFYSFSMIGPCQMSADEILKTFGPILVFYGEKVILPIYGKKFDKAEYMALALIILFDGAHTNISVECSEMCRQVRNLIFRELRGYQIDKNCDEGRFIETVDTLNIVEKGERKFHEELLVCEMNNVYLHDDYRLLLKEMNN